MGEREEIIEMYDNMMDLRHRAREAEEEFRRVMTKSMPTIWKLYADGENWETREPFHIGCDICEHQAVEALRRAIRDGRA